MSQRMHMCPRCENKVRTLYDWKGKNFCGMCQQENIEVYEATIIYRFFLLISLTKDYTKHIRDQVFLPDRGWTRKFAKFTVCNTQGVIAYVRRYLRRARIRRKEKKDLRVYNQRRKAEKKALRKRDKAYRKTERKATRAARAKILKAAR
ncbi:hypothetical protein LCGC14_2123760 [marine sediment metagenome]|uniref:Uncharacterized protein n=1 Tax=marine sediment metagenome TaxID=412755 RepID=A0A0F9E3F8_9ZZZZ